VELRETFDTVAELYERARPGYPDEIVDAIPPGDRVLEVACGTGKLTRSLLARGRDVTCVELGANLVAVARRVVPEARVINANFETWEVDSTYDVVACATAWDWIGPVKYDKAHAALRPSGHLAIIGGAHVFPPGIEDPFFRAIQEVYGEIDGTELDEWPTPDSIDWSGRVDEIVATGVFEDVEERRTLQELRYTPESYIEVLKTFSGHILMSDEQRETLFAGVRRLAGDVIRKHMLVILHTARRIP
jgi:SAM-dependent methyltransferase